MQERSAMAKKKKKSKGKKVKVKAAQIGFVHRCQCVCGKVAPKAT